MKKSKKGNTSFALLIALILICTAGVMGLTWIMNAPDAQTVATQNSAAEAGEAGFEAHYIDVGQADSILVVCGNEAMLIDAGERNTSGNVIEYIKGLGIEELKYVVATHPHSDHIGGMADVLDAFSVQTFIAPDVTHTTKTFENMLDAIERNDIEITVAEPLDEYSLGNSVFTVLSPIEDDYNEMNNYSVVLKAEYGKTAFLFTGDSQSAAEREMLSGGYDLTADVLKVGHHGSSTSTTADFLDAVNPRFAIISCEEGNSYGHPHDEVIKRLSERGISIFQTKDHGTIISGSDGEQISIETTK